MIHSGPLSAVFDVWSTVSSALRKQHATGGGKLPTLLELLEPKGSRATDSLSTSDLTSLTEVLREFSLKYVKSGYFQPSGVVAAREVRGCDAKHKGFLEL